MKLFSLPTWVLIRFAEKSSMSLKECYENSTSITHMFDIALWFNLICMLYCISKLGV